MQRGMPFLCDYERCTSTCHNRWQPACGPLRRVEARLPWPKCMCQRRRPAHTWRPIGRLTCHTPPLRTSFAGAWPESHMVRWSLRPVAIVLFALTSQSTCRYLQFASARGADSASCARCLGPKLPAATLLAFFLSRVPWSAYRCRSLVRRDGKAERRRRRCCTAN